MKNLIIQVLTKTINRLKDSVPKTKKIHESINVDEVKPVDMPKFMADNNIPASAFFSNFRDENDYFGEDEIHLVWTEIVDTNEIDKTKSVKKRFSTAAFKDVYGILCANGYKRVGTGSKALREFGCTDTYKMYVSGDYDRLVDYYSLHFKLK